MIIPKIYWKILIHRHKGDSQETNFGGQKCQKSHTMAKISSAEKLSAPKICVKAEFLSDKIFMYKILSQLLAKLLLIAGPIFCRVLFVSIFYWQNSWCKSFSLSRQIMLPHQTHERTEVHWGRNILTVKNLQKVNIFLPLTYYVGWLLPLFSIQIIWWAWNFNGLKIWYNVLKERRIINYNMITW